MKSAVENLSPTRVKLTVEVPFEELRPALDKAYKRIASQVNVPGFRKGKVPARVIDQRFGRALVLEEAASEAVGEHLEAAVREHDVKLLGRPEVEMGELHDNAPLEFTAEADVVPEFDLPEYAGLEVTVDAAEVTDEDIDKQVDALRSRFGTLLAVERPAGDGDVLLFDLRGTADGAPVEDLTASAMSYEVGTDGIVPGFDDAVRGASAGETRTFTFTPTAGEYLDRLIEVTVDITTVRERSLPDLDDDFAALASEFDTVEELRDDLRSRLARVKLAEQAYAARDEIARVLLEKADVPLPEGVIAAQVEDHFEDGHGDDEHRADVEAEVREALKTQLVLDRIAEAEQVAVSESELSAWLVGQAPRYGMTPDQFAQELVGSGQVTAAVAEVRRGKALSTVLEKATVVDSNGAAVDLSAVFPDRDEESGTLSEVEDDEPSDDSPADGGPAAAE